MAADEEEKALGSDYLLLKPDDVGARGLFHILFSSKKKKKPFFQTTDEENLSDGWILFVSILAQKLLKVVEKPLAWMGAIIELTLNLLSCNGGFIGILFNILQGKLAVPKKSSKDFWSAIAHLDKRVDMDPKLVPESDRFYQSLSLLASKIAYENKAYIEDVVNNRWKMELLSFNDYWNDYEGTADTQAIMLRHKRQDEGEMIIVAFRGTEPFNADDWCSDFDLSWLKLPGVGKMHIGFTKALGMQKGKGWPKEIENDDSHPPTAYYHFREDLRKMLAANPKARFIVTGHSLGGALAIIFPSILLLHGEDEILSRLHSVHTFGQPRVGDAQFGEFVLRGFNEHNVQYIRFVYSNDMVPRIPFDDSGMMFRHFGTCLYYNSIYKGAIVKEEPFKNYFSVFAVLPMTLNAIWEIARSFIYPCTRGPIYREGWFMLSMRVFGLIMPGIPAHIPQDYHNCTLEAIASAIPARVRAQRKMTPPLHKRPIDLPPQR